MEIQERFHGLDAARALALVLGVVLHATMSFFLSFPAKDNSESTSLAVTFFVIHMFRMSVFYLIAGFFAHMMIERRGARGFVKDRAKRIAAPMVVGWIVLAPATIAAVIWGLTRTYASVIPESANAEALAPKGFPLTHLWFLYYLCFFYVAALAVRGVVSAVDRKGVGRARLDALMGAGMATLLIPFVLGAPTFALFYTDASWAAWFGIPTPDTGLTPQLAAVVAYGTAFAFGWMLHRQRTLLPLLARQWGANLAIAVALTIGCLMIIGPVPNVIAPDVIDGGAAMRLAYAGGYVLAVWYWTLGLVGAALRFCSSERPALRYIADSSYWLYLAHLPIVFVLQVLMMEVPLHWTAKYLLIVAVTMTVLLTSYHWLVRSTLLGELLNGRRYPRRSSIAVLAVTAVNTSSPNPRQVEEHATTHVAELIAVRKCYGATVALDQISLAVRQGELLALLGPNGAGKSSALGLWLGTLMPDEGSATVMGGSPLEINSRLSVGVMMQEVTLAPTLTAREHVELASSYYRNPHSVEETLALTGIESLATKRYGRLSGGQKRQVQFAVAVCGRPRLLFLDEPTVGLDLEAREAMWRNIRSLVAEGCSVVLTTHYLEEAEALADRVVVLTRGQLIADGTVNEMRALVTRSHIGCVSAINIDEIRNWDGVVDVWREADMIRITASHAEEIVRRLLAGDPSLKRLDVRQASLAEAFTEVTKEAA